MKKTISIVLLFLLILSNISFADDLNLSGEAAILIDPDTGQVLFEKNPHMKLHPASTTKIMTGILAIELGNLNDIVTIDDEIVSLTDGSHIALEPGERVLFEDLLNALLIESANDAALAIAKHISGSIEGFIKLMNKKAEELGALDTNFVNPNGLTDDNHLTTAYDLSLIAKYAMENPKFREIVGNYTSQIPKTNKKTEQRYLNSHNRLLYSTLKMNIDEQIVPLKYEGATGVKTGYTLAAQNCLVGSATRGNQSFIAVVLKSDGREVFCDVHKLLNYGFDNHIKANIATKDQFIDNINIVNGTNTQVEGILEKDLLTCLPKDKFNDIDKKITLNDQIEAPIKKGDKLGVIEYFLHDEALGQVNIISTLSIEELSPPTIREILLDKWYIVLGGFLVLFSSISLVVLLVKSIIKKGKRKAFY